MRAKFRLGLWIEDDGEDDPVVERSREVVYAAEPTYWLIDTHGEPLTPRKPRFGFTNEP